MGMEMKVRKNGAYGVLAAAALTGMLTAQATAAPSATEVDGISGFSEQGLVGEGRIGNSGLSGTHEITVGKNTAGDDNRAQRVWDNGDPVAFTFELTSGGDATMSIGQEWATYSGLSLSSDFNTLLFRSVTPGPGTKVDLTGLKLNGDVFGDFLNTHDNGSDRLVKWLAVTDDGSDLSTGFKLTGNVTLGWPSGQRPSESRLAFQIKAVNDPGAGIEQIPVPATIAFLGLGLLGLGAASRFYAAKQ
jgi:hypothetical protein